MHQLKNLQCFCPVNGRMGVGLLEFFNTPDQEYVMFILKAVKAMRITQAYSLLRKLDGSKTGRYASRCLDQLRYMQKIWMAGGTLTFPRLHGAPVDEDMLAAIDVMLDLTDIKVHAISSSTLPYKLCFLAEQNNGMGNYAVIVAHPSSEAVTAASLQNTDPDGRTVIFLISELSQAASIKTDLPHFLALNDGGKYKYLSGEA